MNDKNLEFYEKIGVAPLKGFAEQGGFNTHKDLELIYPIIKNSKRVLEIGAGYGRCVDFLLERSFNGEIFSLELSHTFLKHLHEKYSKNEKVTVLDGDIKVVDLPENLDAALWMWSGFIDFSKDQQAECLSRLNGYLKKGGKVIIDIPRLGIKTIAAHKDEKNLVFDTPYGILNCYIPERNDMESFMNECGYRNLEVIDYETTTEKKRTIYVLTK